MLRVLLCLLCAAAAMAAGAEPVAMIVHLPAEARITHGSTTTKGRLLQKLEPNDRVQAVGGDVGIVLIEGGKRFLLAAGQSGIVSAVGIAGARQIAALRAPGLEARTKIGNERGGVNFARPLGDATELVDFPGYYLSGNRKFKWDSGFFQTAKPASYRFSLYDRIGNLLWSTQTTELEAQCPVSVPLPESGPDGFPRLYLWRLDPYKADGTPLGKANEVKGRWGLFSYLTPAQASDLGAQEKQLQNKIKANPDDLDLYVKLADKYLEYGIPMKAINPLLIRRNALADRRNGPEWKQVENALAQVYRQIGRVAIYFAGFHLDADREGSNDGGAVPAQKGTFVSRPLGDAADLQQNFSGWLPYGTSKFSWHRKRGEADLFQTNRNDPSTRPVKYRFTLFDGPGNMLWSGESPTDEIDVPDLHLVSQKPYLWRIDPYKQDGSPLGSNGGGKPKWGIVTFLKPDEAAALASAVADRQKAVDADPSDKSLRAMLAYTYSERGVPMAAIVELIKMEDPSAASAMEQVYSDTGSLAVFFAGFDVKEDRPKEDGT